MRPAGSNDSRLSPPRLESYTKVGARVGSPPSRTEATKAVSPRHAAFMADSFKPSASVGTPPAGAQAVARLEPVVNAEARQKAPRVALRLKNPAGELGYLGPIGPNGPLGAMGPVGQNAWNPSRCITGTLGWEAWAQLATLLGGPLSSMGPLGRNGPLSQQAYGTTVEPLRVGGDEAVLGPAGPLGALGALGPLGPTGAHGFRANANGEYVNRSGEVQRTLTVNWGLDVGKTEELFEQYTEKHAKEMADNDTSFMVEGQLDKPHDADTFAFHSRVDQYVTVLVLPEKGSVVPNAKSAGTDSVAALAQHLDNFDLELLDSKGKVIARSNIRDGSDWLQLKVPAGADLRARVTLKGSPHDDVKPYRLFVVGTGDHTSDLTGGKAWKKGPTSLVARAR